MSIPEKISVDGRVYNLKSIRNEVNPEDIIVNNSWYEPCSKEEEDCNGMTYEEAKLQGEFD